MPQNTTSDTTPMTDHPYRKAGATGYWRSGVAEKGLLGIEKLWSARWPLPQNAGFITFGSCFAQHMSRALTFRDMNWIDAEPAPAGSSWAIRNSYNYGVFSARTGNIYTAAQLLTWVRLASDEMAIEAIELWEDRSGRIYDMLRPQIEPKGFSSTSEARAALRSTARALRRAIARADVLVFTLGLTEGWSHAQTGMTYAICPGTGAGQFDADQHQFHNYTYPETLEDMEQALAILRTLNPDLKVILTVSPVPLVATASGDHVLTATTYSKAVLRAVAGDLAARHTDVDYFPAYELIASPPARAMFFEPDLRGIAAEGVQLVMRHFFAGLDLSAPPRAQEESADGTTDDARTAAEDLVCEELMLERFNDA